MSQEDERVIVIEQYQKNPDGTIEKEMFVREKHEIPKLSVNIGYSDWRDIYKDGGL